MTSRRQLITAAIGTLGLASFPTLGLAAADFYRLETPIPNANGTLIKVYSYDCPFCYRYDEAIDGMLIHELRARGKLRFEPMHMYSRAKYGKAACEALAACRALDEKAKRDFLAKDSLFSRAKEGLYFAYLKKKERWESGTDAFLATVCADTGLSIQDLKAAMRLSRAKELVQQWAAADAAGKNAIPAYIVNGRFLINTHAVKSRAGLLSLIDALADLK